MPEFKADGQFLVWNRRSVAPITSFNYPLSVDAHIFRQEQARYWAAVTQFSNPNELESNWHLQNEPNAPPLMACLPLSPMVNSPVNRVQDQYANKYGETFGFTSEELNIRYLDGDRIDLKSIDPDKVIGCHQEFEVRFK
jgi:hypothetical protein